MLVSPPLSEAVSAALRLDRSLHPHAVYWRVYCRELQRSPTRCVLHYRNQLHGSDHVRTYEVTLVKGHIQFHPTNAWKVV